jgi:polysaccharide pyruvyl transferase WcaK-like protein
MTLAACISVRDQKSVAILKNWNIDSHLTADPVWGLNKDSVHSDTNNGAHNNLRIGISLRQCDALNDSWLDSITTTLQKLLPKDCLIIPLILQESLDKPVIESVVKKLDNVNLEQINLKPDDLPSKWMNAIAGLDLVIAMRLHALIMALKAGIASLALSYDPKVSNVANDFGQPYIDMLAPGAKSLFEARLTELLKDKNELSKRARKTASDKENEARQNKDLLAKFLR